MFSVVVMISASDSPSRGRGLTPGN